MTEYIERDAAMANRREYNLGGSYDNTELAVPVDAIKSIPASDVRPVVKATWKRIDYKPLGHDYKCSSCGWKNDMETHYCPDCGALMEES